MISWVFYGLCIFILLGSILLISAEGHTPIYNIITLIAIFVGASLVYLLMDFYFIGLTYIIVYVGAIAILFLFVVMMVDLGQSPQRIETRYWTFPIGTFLLVVMVFFGRNIDSGIYTYLESDWYIVWMGISDIKSIGTLLYIGYPLALILLGLALWGVMIGIISITSGGTKSSRL